jgi:hypothetical protein
MLIHLLTIFSLIYSVSCEISCYDCSLIPDSYNYIITPTNIPSEIQYCRVTGNHTKCHIDVKWSLTTKSSRLHILPGIDQKRSLSSEHTLQANALISGTGVIQQIQHSFDYFCSTDRCNDVDKLKRILQSLTLNEKFSDLDDLLEPSGSFVGQWCLLYANRTDEDCVSPDGIVPNTCKQCITRFTHGPTTNRICASCFVNDVQEDYLGREVFVDMTDRSSIDTWFIRCRSLNCNGLDTGRRIHEKSSMTFDFDQFFSNRQTILFSLNRITLIIIALIIKICN